MFDIIPFGNRYFAAYDPFKEMEDLEKQFFGRQAPAFKTDIKENDTAFILEAELPGYSKDEIHAEVKGGYLTITAEHKKETEEKDDKYIRRERSYGSYKRTFGIKGINGDAITASYKNGILSLTLPKLEEKKPEAKQLEIQ